MKAEQRLRLEGLLSGLAESELARRLQEAAREVGHLEDADYERLMKTDEDSRTVVNLRRHITWCDICAEEFLRRSAPREQERYLNSARRRRARHRVLAAITGAVLLAAMGTYLWINRPVAAPPVLPWEDAMSVQAEQVEGGSRLRIHCDRGEPHTFAYLLLLGPDGAWPLFPAPLVELANPLGPYPAPETGLPWPNEAATATEILALFAPHRVDRLEDRSYVRTLAARLRAARHDGESLADLLAELRHDLLPPAGRLLRLPIER